MTMVAAKRTPAHDFLEQLVGSWDVTSEMSGGVPWVEVVRSLHGTWYVAEGSGEMAASPATTLLTLGFNASKGRYVGTWVGSMMDHLWVYEGDLEPDGRTLSLYASGPAISGEGVVSGEGVADYREQIIVQSEDHRIFRASVKQPDGDWKPVMEANYRRRA